MILREDNKVGKLNLRFHNIRLDDRFRSVSNQMLRLYDMRKDDPLKTLPQSNPEWLAHKQWEEKK